MPKKKEPVRIIPLAAGVEIGGLVRYYSNGWRTGTLEEVSGNDAGIRPIGGAKHAHLKWVNVSEVEACDQRKG